MRALGRYLDELAAAELCARGMGITLVTDMVATHCHWEKPPTFFRLMEPVEKRHIVAAYSKQTKLPLAAKEFIKFLKENN